MKTSEPQESDQINFEQNKQEPLQKVGAFIKEARIGRGISIEDLAKSLRISKEQLTALENGKEEDLPEKVFIKAMVRRISEKLSLDTNFIINELKERDKSNVVITQKSLEKKNPKNNNQIALACIVSISGILGIVTSTLLINNFKSNQDSSLNQKAYITSHNNFNI